MSERETGPEIIRGGFHAGENLMCLVVNRDGSGIRVTDCTNTLESERLSQAETLAVLMKIFGIDVFKVQ